MDRIHGSVGTSPRSKKWPSSKRHLVDGVPISDLCDKHQLQPAQFYLWQKQLFENGATAFERKTKASGPTPARASGPSSCEAKLVTKNEVIAELMEENVLLKKLDGVL